MGTLVYLAIQVRQNTRALRSSTFQEISNDMCTSSEAVSTSPELAKVLHAGSETLEHLSPEQRMQYSFFYLMTFRRLEAVYIQRVHGFIEAEMTGGFERSVLSVVARGGGAEWWEGAKSAFSNEFAAYVDAKLASSEYPRIHPGL